MKAEYVADRLPECVTQVGMKANIRNFWLFPIIVVCTFYQPNAVKISTVKYSNLVQKAIVKKS